MNLNIEYLKKIYSGNTDFVLREIASGKKEKVHIVFFESLTDSENIYNFVIRPIYSYLNVNKKIKNVEALVAGPKLSKLDKIDDLFYYLENGFVGVIYKDEIYVLEIKANLDRGIPASNTEMSMYGPKDGFCENIQKNIGLIKRRIKSKNLKVESVDHGVYTKNKISLLYLDDKVNKKELEKVKKWLNDFNEKNVTDTYDVCVELSINRIFPIVYKTEKPSLVAKYILKGYVVISVDNTPFALIIDARLDDFVNPFVTDKFVRVLRYICFIMTILTPALYIALINFNPETIPTSLFLSISTQRSGVPFPSVLEAYIMLFICEILRECDIKFPTTYGSSASILGALVMGEAAVNAGIVSPIMIMVVAVSFITNLIFTETKLVGAIRVMRFGLLTIASFLGLYGLFIAIVVLLFIIANVKMFEGEYL